MGRGSIRLFLGWLVGLVVALLTAAPAYASAVSTGSADAITSSGARLNGLLDPSVGAFTWFFQYGTSSDLSSAAESTAPQAASLGAGELDAVSQLVGGLKPGYTYYYRAVLETPASTGTPAAEVFGGAEEFTTVAQALLVKRSSRILDHSVSFPMRCLGQAGTSCTAQLRLTHTRASGHAVTCATSSSQGEALHSWTLTMQLSGRCRSILRHAKHHKLGAILYASFPSGQAALARSVTLVG